MKIHLKESVDYFRKNWKVICVLSAIIILGIYLRSYNFYGFQRFEDDQLRDAQVINKLDQDKNFIIAGPVAKYTNYHLGPAYYYLAYISFKMFGDNPGNLACPALFFSILSIPLLYLVLKKFFAEFISLSLTAIYSVSFNSVEFARFGWNCNLIPFFVLAFVYLLLKIIEREKEPALIWPILAGIVVGIGIQLHTIIIFLFLPIIAIFFSYFLHKKYPLWKTLAIIILIAIFLNIPAIIWDINNKGANTRAFIQAFVQETIFTKDFPHYFLENLKCYIQGNSYVLSPINQNNTCEIFNKQTESSYMLHISNLIFVLFFFGSGIFLIFYYLNKEKGFTKNSFLRIMILYFILTFVIFLPTAYFFDKRYFIVAFLIPYIFLGFWLKLLNEKFKLPASVIFIIFIVPLFISNFLSTRRIFISNPDPFKAESEYYGIDLKKSEEISDSIIKLASDYQGKNIYVSTPTYMRGYQIAIEYFLDKKEPGLGINVTSRYKQIDKDSILFFAYIENDNYNNDVIKFEDYFLIDTRLGDRYGILILKK